MAHFVIEHSNAFHESSDVIHAMETVFDVGSESGIIFGDDIKVRAIPFEHFLFGNHMNCFIHVTVSMLTGRTDSQKERLSIALRSALDEQFPKVQSISIDVRDMNPVAYKKRLLDLN